MGDEIDLSGAVDMLKNMLSSDEGSSAIENIMSMFSDTQETPGVKTGGIDEGSIEMMMKMQKIMSAMNNPQKNKQTIFLQSLKPLLKSERQKSIDNALKFLTIGKAIDAFKEIN